jgi:hypothetical protein
MQSVRSDSFMNIWSQKICYSKTIKSFDDVNLSTALVEPNVKINPRSVLNNKNGNFSVKFNRQAFLQCITTPDVCHYKNEMEISYC